jgi:hypothetical protein
VNWTLTRAAPVAAVVAGLGATPIFTSVVPPSGVVPFSKPVTQFLVTVVVHTGSTV